MKETPSWTRATLFYANNGFCGQAIVRWPCHTARGTFPLPGHTWYKVPAKFALFGDLGGGPVSVRPHIAEPADGTGDG